MLDTFALIGGQEGLIVLLVVLVLFGGKKIPELMRGVGQGIGELKKGMEEGQRNLMDAVHHETTRPVEPDPAPVQPAPVPADNPVTPVSPVKDGDEPKTP